MKIQIVIFLLFCATLGLCESNNSVACDNDFFELNLNRSGIKHVKKFFVSSSRVTHLNLQYNDIEKIENGAFDEMPNLRHLNLTGNNLSQSIFETIYNPSIETLVLDKAFFSYNVEEHRHYRYNYYGRDYVDKINISFPIKFEKLKKLHLCQNNISRIIINETNDPLGYAELPAITHLYLSNNRISSVSFLDHLLPTIKCLHLQHNDISTFVVQPETFNAIEELFLDYNKISRICSNIMLNCGELGDILLNSAMLRLRKLSLSHNKIMSLQLDYLNNYLVELNLSYNLIDEDQVDELLRLTNLKILNLEKNLFHTIPNFCEIRKLEKLVLNNNFIEKIEDEFVCTLNMKNLSLSHNKITFIKSGAFDDLLLLLELDLSGNQLNVLPDNWISAPRNLQSVYLNSNLFTSIDSMSLNNLTDSLKIINISGNPLRFFTLESLTNLPKKTIFEVDDLSRKILG